MTTIDSVLIRCVSRLDAAEEEPTLGWATPTLGKVPKYMYCTYLVTSTLSKTYSTSKQSADFLRRYMSDTYTNLGTVPYLRYCPLPVCLSPSAWQNLGKILKNDD